MHERHSFIEPKDTLPCWRFTIVGLAGTSVTLISLVREGRPERISGIGVGRSFGRRDVTRAERDEVVAVV